jgi:molybdenum cofactor cytidylyltransferase
MRFLTLPIERAEGAILAHSIAGRGVQLKKGRRLLAADIESLGRAGIAEVMAAELGPDDVVEDQVAGLVARAIAGADTSVGEPFTGRANIYAAADGVFTADPQTVIALNSVDEGLTLAIIAPFERVHREQMVATVKVIPFALPRPLVDRAVALAEDAQSRIGVAAFAPRRAGLVLTRFAGTKPSIVEKRRRAIAHRLEACGSTLAEVRDCAHKIDDVRREIGALAEAARDPILVFGASAIVDRGDVVPAGLLAAGGEIVHLGMPVDPGNLLMLGRIGTADVIGVPSCAASAKTNGFDWVLERRLAGLRVGSAEIIAMAPGGLLKEISTRPQPREGGPEPDDRRAPEIAAIVLAAGRSSRMGSSNKLLEDVAGRPMIRATVETALASRARTVIVVTGHDEDRVRAALDGLEVRLVRNPEYQRGIGTSISAGLSSLPASQDGALVLLGDMPLVRSSDLDRLIAAYAPKESRSICVPTFQGKRGNPVLWGSLFFPLLRRLGEDFGGKQVMADNGEAIVEVEMGHAGVLMDADTPDALSVLRSALGGAADASRT